MAQFERNRPEKATKKDSPENPPTIQELISAAENAPVVDGCLGVCKSVSAEFEFNDEGLELVEYQVKGPEAVGYKIVETEYGQVALPALSESELEILKIKTNEDLARALKGDGGGHSSVGYSPRYARNYDDIFGKN